MNNPMYGRPIGLGFKVVHAIERSDGTYLVLAYASRDAHWALWKRAWEPEGSPRLEGSNGSYFEIQEAHAKGAYLRRAVEILLGQIETARDKLVEDE